MTSWVHVSAGETALGESRPLECLRTETKTCIFWRSGIWGGIVFVWLGSAHTVRSVCFVWEGGRRLKQLSLFISAYWKWLRTACFNKQQAALGRLFLSSPSDGSQLSANTEQLWMTMVESAEVTCVFLYNGQYSLLIEWEVSVIEWKKVFSGLVRLVVWGQLYSQQLVKRRMIEWRWTNIVLLCMIKVDWLLLLSVGQSYNCDIWEFLKQDISTIFPLFVFK